MVRKDSDCDIDTGCSYWPSLEWSDWHNDGISISIVSLPYYVGIAINLQ